MAFKNRKSPWSFAFRLLAVAFLLSLPVISQHAFADDPTTPCDPDYMDALEARAWMEAQREVSQNQNLIFKPDSVLEYTCFDQFLGVLGNDGLWDPDGPFSDTNRWGAVPFQGPGSLLTTLSGVVDEALVSYLGANFNYDYLNTRVAGHYTPAAALGAGSYNCDQMQTVWNAAQCLDFGNKTDQDMFYDFYWYNTNDPRQLPVEACTPTGLMGDAMDVAFNGNQVNYSLDPENEWPASNANYYVDDPVVTHFDLILPLSDGTAAMPTPPYPANCGDPIPTGVCVVRAGWDSVYQDAICANPGCHYVAPGAAASGTPDPTGLPGYPWHLRRSLISRIVCRC